VGAVLSEENACILSQNDARQQAFCVKTLDFFDKVCYNENIRRNYMFAPQVFHVLKA